MSECKTLYGAGPDEITARHPCYSASAHHLFARMHLAVAPACNIQCNYCNRKYDCASESRPGVVSERLSPDEALTKVYHVAAKVKELSVIGIAGPGDALAAPERTFKTLRLIKEHFPDLTLCLSTNGMALPEHAQELYELGVRHITVTVNTFDPATANRIYAWALVDGHKATGVEAMEYFLARQRDGIRMMADLGALVKVNSILIPGINAHELPSLSRKLKLMGAHMHNIMPLISDPAHGTAFGLAHMAEPSAAELENAREACGDIQQMAHCRQCRADAVGKLSEDRFADFSKARFAGVSCAIPADNGAAGREKWREHAARFISTRGGGDKVANCEKRGGSYLVAALSKSMGLVNQHFGHAKEFYIYRVADGQARLVNVRKVKRSFCDGPMTCGDESAALDDIIGTIQDCDAVVCLKVGYGPHKALTAAGIAPVTDMPYMQMEHAAAAAAERLDSMNIAPELPLEKKGSAP
ncbi:MAG: nitrogenase cofactor biosynthesis protein NifB [Nitrospinae bacterium]|nr:nitrogenase cofactor biosynthesis protein NifB [Nitrospinota bacterium]